MKKGLKDPYLVYTVYTCSLFISIIYLTSAETIMNNPVKWTFISFLFLICISASLFMILESGTFFQRLYKDHDVFTYMGYWAAFLNEIFMAIMAGVWLPARSRKGKSKTHPLNFLFKGILIFLFITTVCGASLNTVTPLIEGLQKETNNERVIDVLQSQVDDHQKSLETFAQQNQRVNSAITVRNQVKTKEELKNLLSDRQSTFTLWVEIIAVVLIRFGVQLANLCCVWLCGWIYRQPDAGEGVNTEEKGTFNGKENRELKQKNRYVPRSRKEDQPSPVNQESQRKSGTKGRPIHRQFGNDQVVELQKRIVEMIKSRNEGVSVSQLCQAIGEKESNLREMVNPHSGMGEEQIPILESILKKITQLVENEHAVSY